MLLQPPGRGPAAPSADRAIASPVGTPAPQANRPPAGEQAEVARRDSTPAPAAAVDEPVALRVPSVGLQMGVVPVGVRDDGQMDVPELVSELGWYRFGPAPGAAEGSAVLAAHVDSELGSAPMAAVLRAGVGDPVEVTTRTGVELRYRITAVEQLSKHALPLDSLFERDGAHLLRLVTCGGAWDTTARAYEDNIVVTAVLDAS